MEVGIEGGMERFAPFLESPEPDLGLSEGCKRTSLFEVVACESDGTRCHAIRLDRILAGLPRQKCGHQHMRNAEIIRFAVDLTQQRDCFVELVERVEIVCEPIA